MQHIPHLNDHHTSHPPTLVSVEDEKQMRLFGGSENHGSSEWRSEKIVKKEYPRASFSADGEYAYSV